MPQHERVQWAQLRVGVMVIVSLALFAIAVFFISGQVGFFTRHYTLKAYLPSAGDLREGAQVRLAGISVGNVAKIRISPYPDRQRAVELDLKIARTYQNEIRADSVASVETVGLLGDSYVDITRGTAGQEVIADGGAVKTAEKADIAAVVQNTNEVIMNLNALSAKLDDITTQIQAGKGSMGKLLYDQTLYNKMDATVSGAQSLVERAQRGEGTLGKLMSDETLYNRTVATLDRLNNVIDDVQHGEGSLAKFISDPSAYNNLNRLMANGNTLIAGINQGHGTLGKLAKDEQLYNRMNSTLAHMDTITARIDHGQGTLGKLSTDPTLFNNLRESSQSLKEFLADFRKNPKKYLSIKLHIF
ncbi:MAG: MlaD family protein [Terriglobia bacterium]|jgi:phospholipid/cholesterol/gamma-HCH transport system substrate-binding protein